MDPFLAIFERAKTFCRTSSDRLHLQESAECTKWLCEREGGDPAIVMPAILLHDIGWSIFSDEENTLARGLTMEARMVNHRHEEEGAILARLVLEELDYDPALIDEITEIILWHDSKTIPRSTNDAIVKDGNLLSRYTPASFDATRRQLNISEAELARSLQEIIERGFHTKTARLAARRYLCKRRLRSIQTAQGGLTDRLLDILLELGDRVLMKAQKSLEQVAIDGLKQRLVDYRRQLEIYLECHPAATISQLQQDKSFQELAVQRILTEGYTGIIDICKDSPTYGQVIFHPDARMVNQPVETLRKERPSNVVHSFWDWYWRAIAGEEFSSYYRSKDTADTAREKVQCVAPMRFGRMEWSLVVSAYVDQSFDHAYALAAEISSSINSMLDELDIHMLLPLSRFIFDSEVIAAGDLSHRVHVQTDNEFSMLATAFNSMVQSIEQSNHQMQDYARQLENQRDELQSSVQVIEQQRASIAQLSAPVIRVWRHVLVLPLLGDIDLARGQRITETLLHRVVEERAHHVFIDLTGVAAASREVIGMLLNITQTIRLLGADCTLTGIRPEMAGPLSAFTAELGHIHTEMNLEHGLRKVLSSASGRRRTS